MTDQTLEVRPAAKPRRIITSDELLTLRAFVPETKELNAAIQFDDAGHLKSLRLGFGTECKNGSCHAQYCGPGVCLHSHPFSNRISSADAAVLVQRSVAVSDSCSLIIAPMGVFIYRAMPWLVAKWKTMSATDKLSQRREWQFIGLALQSVTQEGNVQTFLQKMVQSGIQTSYASWEDITQGGVVAL